VNGKYILSRGLKNVLWSSQLVQTSEQTFYYFYFLQVALNL